MSVFSDIRHDALMTQREFGEQVGYTNVWVSRIERDPSLMSLATLGKYYSIASERDKEAVRAYVNEHVLAG